MPGEQQPTSQSAEGLQLLLSVLAQAGADPSILKMLEATLGGGQQVEPLPLSVTGPLIPRAPFTGAGELGQASGTPGATTGPRATGTPFVFTGGSPFEPNAGAQQALALSDLALNLSSAFAQRKAEQKKQQGVQSGNSTS
jgi:hypothetical protein